jgi:uncharacterized surface protein with fasciclin (FAS1) repeats
MANVLNSLPKRFMFGLVGLGAMATLAACGDSLNSADVEPTAEEPVAMEQEEPMAQTGDSVVDVAASDESFNTLATAIEAAGLTDTLSTDGPYTVFAPTDEAFESLPEGTLEQLLEPQNQETLAQILSYHVVPQEVTSSEITAGDVETVAGAPVSITVDESTGEVMVNEAMVVQPDITASNGVIHAIDQVMLPPNISL